MKLIKSYKYRIYPNVTQKILLTKTFGHNRFVWNKLVESFNSYDNETNPKPEYLNSTEFRKEYVWMKEVSAVSLQQTIRNFDQTKKQYFNKKRKTKLGRMKFKNKFNKQSFRVPNQSFRFENNKIFIIKLGYIKMVQERPIPTNARLLSCTVSKNPSGQYFVSINFEVIQEPKIKTSEINVGIDLGVSSLATLSDGIQFKNPKKFRENQSKLKRAQQHLSRKTKGSNRFKKQKLKVAQIHQSIVNQREWYLHNISKYIVDNYNEIGMEDLDVASMLKQRKMSNSLADSSMSKLKGFIIYKQLEYNKNVQLLNKWSPSTKVCSQCGHIQSMKLSDRTFNCKSCKQTMDRDLNASMVIKNKTVGGVTSTKQTWSEDKILHQNIDVIHLLRSVDYNLKEYSNILS